MTANDHEILVPCGGHIAVLMRIRGRKTKIAYYGLGDMLPEEAEINRASMLSTDLSNGASCACGSALSADAVILVGRDCHSLICPSCWIDLKSKLAMQDEDCEEPDPEGSYDDPNDTTSADTSDRLCPKDRYGVDCGTCPFCSEGDCLCDGPDDEDEPEGSWECDADETSHADYLMTIADTIETK